MENMHTDVRMWRINQIHICMHSAAMMVKSKNSMENMHTDVRMWRINQIHICMHSAAMMVKSRHILHTILKGAGSISLQNFVPS